ncbi:MAG: DMT family transporter [Chloroflexi bacterium]|jgi:drug/metabolite transporter (DMT)-like permease|nr:DMT family transporter [Chloroflexota bacterium]
MDRRRIEGIALVAISACAFGSGGLFAAPVYAADVDWMTLLAWRFVFGAALLWGWLLLSGGRRRLLRSLTRREVLVTLGLGVLYVGNSGTYFWALETVPVSLAALIIYIYPAVVAVLSIRWARRLPGRRPWIALGIALAGVVLAIGGIPSTEIPPLFGLVLIVASPLIYSVWIVLAARFSGEHRRAASVTETTAGETAGDASVVAMPVMMLATLAVYWVAALGTGRPVLPAQIPVEAWPGILGVGVVSTAIAVQTFYAGARRIGAAQASLVSTIEPVWTITLAALLLGQSLTPMQLVGAVLVIAGVVIAQTAPPGEGPEPLEVRLADE